MRQVPKGAPLHICWVHHFLKAAQKGHHTEHPFVKLGLFRDEEITFPTWSVRAQAVLETYLDHVLMAVCEFIYRFAQVAERTRTVETLGLVQVWKAMGIDWSKPSPALQGLNDTIAFRSVQTVNRVTNPLIKWNNCLIYIKHLRDDTILVSIPALNSIASFFECLAVDLVASIARAALHDRAARVDIPHFDRGVEQSLFAQALDPDSSLHPGKWISAEALANPTKPTCIALAMVSRVYSLSRTVPVIVQEPWDDTVQRIHRTYHDARLALEPVVPSKVLDTARIIASILPRHTEALSELVPHLPKRK